MEIEDSHANFPITKSKITILRSVSRIANDSEKIIFPEFHSTIRQRQQTKSIHNLKIGIKCEQTIFGNNFAVDLLAEFAMVWEI